MGRRRRPADNPQEYALMAIKVLKRFYEPKYRRYIEFYKGMFIGAGGDPIKLRRVLEELDRESST